MKNLLIALVFTASVARAGDYPPATQASEITPPLVMQGNTSDKGPMVYDVKKMWEELKHFFSKKHK